MTRTEAWEKFSAIHKEEQNQLRQTFWDNLQTRLETLMECIYTAFEEIAQQAKEQKKDDCMYFLYSLQRCDLTENRAIVRLDVMDISWYLDEKPLTASFDLTFLFQEYFEWKEKLLLDMREYMGRVNRYDVEYLLQDEIMICNQLITHLLRFAFRNLEQQEAFSRIGKLPFWLIRWGEYKDYSEIVMRVNREVRTLENWLEKLEKYEEDPGVLNAEYWYRMNLTSGNCQKKNMYFTVFEDCTLKGINFKKAGLSGARFIRCHIENCDFSQSDLNRADFEDCSFQNNQFRNASLDQATFSESGFPIDSFAEQQLAALLIVKEAEEQKGE